MNWNNCYNANGQFVPDLCFTEIFGVKPQYMCLTFNGERMDCDLEKITDCLIYEIIPKVNYINRIISKYTIIDKEIDSKEYELKVADAGTAIYILTDSAMYLIDSDSISYRTSIPFGNDSKKVEDYLKDIWNKLPKKEVKGKEATVNLIAFSNGDYYTIEKKVKRVNIDIDENYNDDFKPVYDDIIKFLGTRESGLVLLYGTAGAGKSSIIRHLCNHCPANYVIVPTSLTTKLADADFITFMMDNSDSVFVLEDCEQLLMDRSVNIFNGAISNILNMSDGLLSDVMNIKFICTFNADIKTIDPALLRKGRCYAKYEFKELCKEKVENLNNKYNLGITEIKPMTLAQIYHADETEYSDTKVKRKIGF